MTPRRGRLIDQLEGRHRSAVGVNVIEVQVARVASPIARKTARLAPVRAGHADLRPTDRRTIEQPIDSKRRWENQRANISRVRDHCFARFHRLRHQEQLTKFWFLSC